MPIVRIDIEAGKPAEYRRQVLASVRAAIVSALGVPSDRIMSRLVETPAENLDAPAKTDRLTIVEISMLPGRGPELQEPDDDETLTAASTKRLSPGSGTSRISTQATSWCSSTIPPPSASRSAASCSARCGRRRKAMMIGD